MTMFPGTLCTSTDLQKKIVSLSLSSGFTRISTTPECREIKVVFLTATSVCPPGGGLQYKKEGVLVVPLGVKKIVWQQLGPEFSLKTCTAGVFAVPFKILS